MNPSRLERFQAAIKDDMAKLPDKPSQEPEPQPAKTQSSADVEPGMSLLSQSLTDKTNTTTQSNVKTQQAATLGVENLNIINGGNSDSEDSEAGCPIELVPVTNEDDERVQDITNATPDETKTTATDSGMHQGQVTIHGESFCPILALSKFPYRYIPKAESEAIADTFFNGGKFWLRDWDLFYVWPLEFAEKPLILVREEQFKQLLKEIGATFRKLHLDPKDQYYRMIKLVIPSFPDHPRLLPRYLGHSTSRSQHDDLVFQAPHQRQDKFVGEPMWTRPPTDEETGTFNDLYETVMDLNKAKNKGGNNKKRQARVFMQSNLSKQLKRAQRYLGLRLKKDRTNPYADGSLTFEEQQALAAKLQTANYVPSIDLSKPAPYPPDEEPVIICVDVEAWERSKSIITEVGIATLDTRELTGVAPGQGGKNWMEKIRARHFRIRQHMMYENTEFVQGNADRFEFGDSEIIDLKDAPRIVASCFKEPFSKEMTQKEVTASWNKQSEEKDDTEDPKPKRNIVFLGHNPSADIDFLHRLGYDPLNLSTLLETMDTASLFRAYKKEQNPRSVGNILADLELEGWNLHNAGNDAVYTMCIMIGVCIREAMKREGKGSDGDESDEPTKNTILSVSKTGAEGKGKTSVLKQPEEPQWEVPEEYKV